MNDQIYDHSLSQEDDISILPSEDDVNAVSPHVIPYFNLTASRYQLPSTSGISSMEALRNAYEELKKKYNDLNLKYETLYAFARKNYRADFLPDELPSGSHSLDEKNKILEMSRKDEIEKLHNAILRLNHELSEEKSKNIKLSVQINSFKEMSRPTCVEGPSEKCLTVLEDLRKNVEILEKSVETHEVILSKQLPHPKLDTQTLFGKSDFISQRKQQSEHDELSSLGNKPVHSPSVISKVLSAAATASTEQVKKVPWLQHKPEESKTRPSIVNLKNIRLKQDKQPDITHTTTTTHLSPKYILPNILSSLSSSSQSSSTTTTNSDINDRLVREKDLPYLNNTEALPSGDESLCVSEMLCPICEKPFTNLSKFQEHVFDCKSDPLDRSCPVCLKNFKNASQEIFEKHVHTHFDQPGDDFDILNF